MKKILLFSLVAIIILAGCSKQPTPKQPPQVQPIACTQEAKICPNGSAVGRTGPNCEFTPCP